MFKPIRVFLLASMALAGSMLAMVAPAAAANVSKAVCYLDATGANCQEVSKVYPLPVRLKPQITVITASSGNVANTAAVATLTAPGAGLTNYITGFSCSAAGATAAANVSLAVSGVVTGTMTYTFVFPAGATAVATPVNVQFSQAIPASAANTAIVVTLPAGGTGNTHASCSAQGFTL